MTALDIPFERHVLANGLRVVIHRDPKTPVVTTSLWYHVGSKNESPGKTGFAHLFEHLMFEGSEHHDGEYFRPLEAAGASRINGTTSRDRTNYYQTVPVNALDLALWLESDRMGHLLGVMTQEKLDEQRAVVRNEKKQSENQPYGRVPEILARSLYPVGHPYSWPIIGSMRDLADATLDDVRDWFRTWYGPSNAVLVLSGDLDPDDALARAERHFGAIAPGPPLERPGRWIARHDAAREILLEDRVPQARAYRAWNVPPIYTEDHHRLSLLARLLSTGKSSRLYRRLVYEDQIATDAHAYLWSGEIGSSFVMQATCAPDASLAAVERALDEELRRVLDDGLDDSEVDRARNRMLASFLRGLERTGGPGGKSEVLAHGEVFRGAPDAFRETLASVEAATAARLRRTAERWLTEGAVRVRVEPVPAWSPGDGDVARDAPPAVGRPPRPVFPQPETTRLSSGLEIVRAPWGDLPLLHLGYLVDAGFAADRASAGTAFPRGTATLAMQGVDEGTAARSALEISDTVGGLGARLTAGAGLDSCRVGLSALTDRLDDSLEVFADVLCDPAFPIAEVERLKRERLARIARERATPVQLALRVLPTLLYGDGHPYGTSFTGSGTEADVRATARDHLADFHATWLGPRGAKLICVGDPEATRLEERLERLLGGWRKQSAPSKSLPDAAPDAPAGIHLLDRPDAIQSIVFGGQVVPRRGHDDELALEMFHHALGGAFSSRLNLNLREDKGWTYGAHSLLWSARGQRPLLLYSSVQTDRTAETIQEMDRELRDLLQDRPIRADELEMGRTQLVGSLPAQWETLGGLSGALEEIVVYDLPADYWEQYTERTLSLSAAEVTDAAGRWIAPERFVWVVVGDAAKVRAPLERLGLGPVETLTDDG